MVVLSGEFAPRLADLAHSYHVWVVRTSATEKVAHRIWGEQPPQEVNPPMAGITLFTGTGDPEDDLLSIIDTVELHHGLAGGRVPAANSIRVLGTPPTDSVREVFRSLGFSHLVKTSDGFVAHWNPPVNADLAYDG